MGGNRPSIQGLAGLLLLGCGASGPGTFGPTAYHHDSYEYSIPYASATEREVIGPDWNLDNYYGERDSLSPKQGADYEATLYVDADGDGEADDLGERYTYDLRFTHKHTSATIWLRTVPIESSLETKDLRVLARAFISKMSGTFYETVQLQGELVRVAKERTYAIEELGAAEGTIAGRSALRTDLSIVDVDQLKASPNARRSKVRLVLMMTPFRLVRSTEMGMRYDLPVLMLAGYAAHDDDFDSSLSDFESFLQRIEIAGKRGCAFPVDEPADPPLEAPAEEPVDAPGGVVAEELGDVPTAP